MPNNYTRIMFHKTLIIILTLFCFNCPPIFGKLSEQKSSLTFVIDDTISMADDIDQVRVAAKLILDAVLESKASRIGNFVLVRFNDPDIKPAFITTNKEDYIRALNDIVLTGNLDCPEMAMKGIEEALKKSLPRSYIFVFTDASAKDYKNFAVIKSIAQEKSSQIIFVLTGLCSTEEDPAYLVYHELAKATSGQVFHLEKNEIVQILQYTTEIVKAPRTVLAEKDFGPGYENRLFFIVDGKIRNVIAAVSGKSPKVEVLDPRGDKTQFKIIMETTNILVIMVDNTEQGTHTVIVGSLSRTKVIITGATTFDFNYGFSLMKPVSIMETVTRPIAEIPSYLAIDLDNPDNDVQLNEVNLLDTNENVLQVLPLNKLNEDFYLTEPMIPPNTMFKILVKGFIKGTRIPVKRVSPTPIEPEKRTSAPPTIKEDVNTVSTESGKFVDLDCVVSGDPTPRVFWSFNGGNIDTTHVIFGKTNTLRMRASLKNAGTYTCEAVNVIGVAKRTIQLIVYESPNIKVPAETTLEKFVGCPLTLSCESTGFPKPSIQWKYYNADTVETFLTYTDASGSLHIPQLKRAENGYYVCVAENSLGSDKINYTVKVLSPPATTKSPHVSVEAFVGDLGLELLCQATGNPKPTIAWTKDGVYIPQGSDCYSDTKYGIKDEGALIIGNIDNLSNGTYACVAKNKVGIDIDSVNVVVSQYPRPEKWDKLVKIEVGISATIKCHLPHGPSDVVTWYKDSKVIATGDLIINNPQLSDKGLFTCKVNAGISASISVQVGLKPKFIHDENKYLSFFLNEQAHLSCVARGEPLPKVSWEHNDHPLYVDSMLYTFKMSEAAEGKYTCTVRNSFGTITRDFIVVLLI